MLEILRQFVACQRQTGWTEVISVKCNQHRYGIYICTLLLFTPSVFWAFKTVNYFKKNIKYHIYKPVQLESACLKKKRLDSLPKNRMGRVEHSSGGRECHALGAWSFSWFFVKKRDCVYMLTTWSLTQVYFYSTHMRQVAITVSMICIQWGTI